MKKWIIVGIITLFMSYKVHADILGSREAFPIYTRALRVTRPRIVVVKPVPNAPQLSQEQRPQEQLAQRQLTEEEIKAAQERIAQKAEEARIAGYSHMYGTSDLYGGLYNR